MKRIYIVTGANGFLGNTIVRELVRTSDCEVRTLILPNDSVQSLVNVNCQRYVGDVTDIATLKDIFSVPPDVELCVIHAAGIVYIKSKKNPMIEKVNVIGTMNIVQKVLETNAKLVYVNSVHAIPELPHQVTMSEIKDFDPQRVKGIYAKSKAKAAQYVLRMVREQHLNACIIHPSGIIGPNDYGRSHLTQLVIDTVKGRLKACVNGGYDFVDVRDVAIGIIKAVDLGKSGECYILSNKYFKVKELLDIICEVRGIKTIKTILPMWLAKITAPLSELYYNLKKQPPLYTIYSLYTLTINSSFSNAFAKAQLGYQTRDINDTIKDTIEWLEENHRL